MFRRRGWAEEENGWREGLGWDDLEGRLIREENNSEGADCNEAQTLVHLGTIGLSCRSSTDLIA